MNHRRRTQEAHEGAVIDTFIQWLGSRSFPPFEIIARPDPPDAILQAGSDLLWVEVADVYRSADEAHEERSAATPGETRFTHREHPIINPDDRMADALLRVVVNKLNRSTYRQVYEQYGPGVLICCERDPLFDSSTLEAIRDRFDEQTCSELSTLNGGVFKEIYLYERPTIFHQLCSFLQPSL